MGPGYAVKWQLHFIDAASPIMEGIINIHADLMAVLMFILGFLGWILTRAIFKFSDLNTKALTVTPVPVVYDHKASVLLELVWTIIPSFFLFAIVVPSFSLLYAMDELVDPCVTLKVIGRQWYWSYEYDDYSKPIEFDSFMVQEDDLIQGQLRLLEVDNAVLLPTDLHIRVLVTSADVLHSWAVPALGVKMDACPGRLNQVNVFIKRAGDYYGQCSEICGANHGFMPIKIQAVTPSAYLNWVKIQEAK